MNQVHCIGQLYNQLYRFWFSRLSLESFVCGGRGSAPVTQQTSASCVPYSTPCSCFPHYPTNNESDGGHLKSFEKLSKDEFSHAIFYFRTEVSTDGLRMRLISSYFQG